jgi:hypothetical protein
MSKEDPEQCLLIGGEPIQFDPADHVLKVWSEYFWAIGEGKEFELRRDDRDYKVGDLVRLREYLCQRRSWRTRACRSTAGSATSSEARRRSGSGSSRATASLGWRSRTRRSGRTR